MEKRVCKTPEITHAHEFFPPWGRLWLPLDGDGRKLGRVKSRGLLNAWGPFITGCEQANSRHFKSLPMGGRTHVSDAFESSTQGDQR